MKGLIRKGLHRLGYDLVRRTVGDGPESENIADLTDTEKGIISRVRPYTMTGVARIAALLNAVSYVSRNAIPGDVAECGVWRGGSMMAVALALLAHEDTSRSLYLYDTFEGMSPPGDHDKTSFGEPAEALRERVVGKTRPWCHASLEDVRANILSTGYPADRLHFVKGKVEETIPETMPSNLALLRIDTDWYESTRHELTHLFPLLKSAGVLIIDDYGYWNGARKAVDEYFQQRNERVYLHRIDCTARLLIKQGVAG